MTGPTPPFNPNVPSIARTYDYLLGGKDNYPVDREIGEIFIQRFPGAVQIAVDNRRCLVRAVDFMARDLGVTQFLDLGSGLPTADNVHQVAQRANLTARVVYVDNDPIVLAHGRALLAENDFTAVVKADVREPEQILTAKETNALIDFDRPVGIIASAILHHIVDEEDPLGIIRAFRDAVPAGSYLFISHFRTLGDPDSAALEEVMFSGVRARRLADRCADRAVFRRCRSARAGHRVVRRNGDPRQTPANSPCTSASWWPASAENDRAAPLTSGAACARSHPRCAACSRCRRGCASRRPGTAHAAGRGRRGRAPRRARACRGRGARRC